MTKANEYQGDSCAREPTQTNNSLGDGGPLPPILKALKFASKRHTRQRRKDSDGSPYVNHLIDIAQVLVCVAGVTDPTTIQGAILHDTIEDTQTTAGDLEKAFGPEVRLLVEEVTDDKQLSKLERKRLQIEHARELSVAAKLIKIADKISNVRDVVHSPPVDWTLQRRQEYIDWTEKVVSGCRGCNPALEDLYDRTVAAGRRMLVQQAEPSNG